MQSSAGSESFKEPEEQADMSGEMKSSDSDRERSSRGPGMESEEEAGEEGEGGGGGEEILSMRDLHW